MITETTTGCTMILPLCRRCVSSLSILITGIGLLVWGGAPAQAEVSLPALLSDHAVLQGSARTNVWGTASPGEPVHVALGGAQADTVAGTDGKWTVALDLSRVGPGPFELTVTGRNTLTVRDVLVGEVWLAAGQSNMAFPLEKSIGYQEELAHPVDARLRHFLVSRRTDASPQDSCQGEWVVASPATVGRFSAVAYHFGKTLTASLATPVGLINASWGGTPVEAWTSREALERQPGMAESIERITNVITGFDHARTTYAQALRAWERNLHRENVTTDPGRFAAPEADTADWKAIELPGRFRDRGLPDAGVVWLRRSISVGTPGACTLRLAGADGFVSVFINGKPVKEFTPENYHEAAAGFPVDPQLLHQGDNLIAIRLHQARGGMGMLNGGHYFMLGDRKLAGTWLATAETAYPAMSAEEAAACPLPPAKPLGVPERPAQLYNGMIHPLRHMGITGAIWYQGEHNSGRGFAYRTSFPAMIQDWRTRWGWEFPFLYCQLPNNGGKSKVPGGSNWAELRAAQTAALDLPGTAQAILIDVGEADDLHPRNKQIPGERLARLALAKIHGRDVAAESPRYDHARVEGDRIRIHFAVPTGGLVARPVPSTYVACSLDDVSKPLVRNSPGSELEGFAICGADRKWVWADARIDGDTVVVWSASVPSPVAVRHAWSDNPTVNLYNQAGLPAGPFRTDDEPWVSAAARY